MSGQSATPNSADPALSPGPDFGFPKSARILRRSDFRKVYDEGFRHSCPFFAAFCLRRADLAGPRVGFTVSKAAGKAVYRNRIKRRLREAVRLHLADLPDQWWIVLNGRKSAADGSFTALEREIQTLFQRCVNS